MPFTVNNLMLRTFVEVVLIALVRHVAAVLEFIATLLLKCCLYYKLSLSSYVSIKTNTSFELADPKEIGLKFFIFTNSSCPSV